MLINANKCVLINRQSLLALWPQLARLRHQSSANDRSRRWARRQRPDPKTTGDRTDEAVRRPVRPEPLATRSPNVDYLGIFEADNQLVSGLYDNDPNDDPIDKYKDLVGSRSAKMSDQHLMVTTFGRVRLDADNEPRIHGQYETLNRRPKFDMNNFEQRLSDSRAAAPEDKPVDVGVEDSNPFEEQYFDGISSADKTRVDDNVVNTSGKSNDNKETDFGFIDEQFFVHNINVEPLIKRKINFKYNQQFNEFLEQRSVDEHNIFHNLVRDDSHYGGHNARHRKRSDIEDIDDIQDIQYNRESPLKDNKEAMSGTTDSPLKPELFSLDFELNSDLNEKPIDKLLEKNKLMKEKLDEQKDIRLEDCLPVTKDYSKKQRTGAQYLADLQSGEERPQYPHKFNDEVKNYRSELGLGKEKLDSKGFRILSGQVFDFTKFPKEDIEALLMKSILFDDIDIVAINKPYGMSIHTKETPVTPVLTDYLPHLQRELRCEKLYTVHRLDRDTTGVLLLAKSQAKAKELNRMFCEHKILKRYICITRGVPDQLEGIIDIPVDIGRCDGKERMVLRPEALQEYRDKIKPSKQAKRAVTQYKVVSHADNAALIEVWPETGIRHQIRVHLGFGLRCPILGDHKYSHLDKIAPQKLTGDMLLALNVRQSKVRHIPMHLHAKQYCLPNAGIDGKNIFVNAPIPHHFHKNMSKLGLKQ